MEAVIKEDENGKATCTVDSCSFSMDRVIRKLGCRLLAWLQRSRSGVSFVKHISYKDIKRATDGFHRIVYGSSLGTAYMAKFEHGGVVLVKEARALSEAEDAFHREIQFLGRLHHRHLLPLTGFSNGKKRFLVFDNVENGSLRGHLNDPLRTPLNWKIRLQIAVGVAAAIEYLFLFSSLPVYHVSISSSNIMLDEHFTAKLSDVGLVSSVGRYAEKPHPLCSKDCMGHQCNKIVHQLGLLLLELVTGQSSEEENSDLIKWIQGPSFVSCMHQMIDPDLGNSYQSRELKKLMSVARLCLKPRKSTLPVPQLCRYIQNKLDTSSE